jgi:glycerophosphoryl diester phosphodiesterase
MNMIEVIGHRGAKGHEPENTLLAVEKGMALGADCIEIDVHRAGEGLVVIHDGRLERTTNGTGPVAGRSIEYLRNLDAGKGEKIPFLQEVFDLIDRRVRLNIELKDEIAAPLVADTIRHNVRDCGWQWENLIVCSFLLGQLKRIKTILPELSIGLLIAGQPTDLAAPAARLGARSINPGFDSVNRALVDDTHARGLKIYPYTVNNPEDISRMITLGVDGIISDYPDRVIEARTTKGVQ